MNRLLITVLLVVLAACSVPGSQVDDLPGLPGTYVVNGVDPLGIEYSGTVVITEGQGIDRFRISWVVTGAILEGDGVVTGNTLEVDWFTVQGPRGEATGTARYTIGTDGVLSGERTIEGVDGVGTEEIFPSG